MSVEPPRLKIELQPLPAKDRLTTCNLSIFVDGKEAWPVLGENDVSVEVQIDDLLAHLTEFWKPLILRQVFPIDVSPLCPSDLRRLAEQRWAELPPEVTEREEEAGVDLRGRSRFVPGVRRTLRTPVGLADAIV